MNLVLALLVWVLMAVVLGVGMVLAVKGSVWLLLIGVIGFFVAMGRLGCTEH